MKRLLLFIALILALTGCGAKEIAFEDCEPYGLGGFIFYVPKNLKYDEGLSVEEVKTFKTDDALLHIGISDEGYEFSEEGMEQIEAEIGENAKKELSNINGYEVMKLSYKSTTKGMTLEHRQAYVMIGDKVYFVTLSWKNGDYQEEFDAILRYSLED